MAFYRCVPRNLRRAVRRLISLAVHDSGVDDGLSAAVGVCKLGHCDVLLVGRLERETTGGLSVLTSILRIL